MSVLSRPFAFAAVCALLAGALSTVAARAEGSVSESETYIQRGIELRRMGKNGDALSLFERAYALDPTPRAEAQIALARQATGDWIGAEQGLERALNAADDPWIARFRDALTRALAKVGTHLGWLDVDANVARGELVVDANSHYDLPLASRVRIVAHVVNVEVTAPDRVPVQRTVEVAPGAEVHLVIALEPVSVVAPPVPQASAVEGATPRPEILPGKIAPPVGGYLAIAAAAGLAGGGLAAWRVRESQVAIYDDDSRCLVGTVNRQQQCGGHLQTANVALGLELGAFAAAAASTALGVWLLWPRARSRTVADASCGPWASLGVACEGRF
jgi:hypothetical protein